MDCATAEQCCAVLNSEGEKKMYLILQYHEMEVKRNQ